VEARNFEIRKHLLEYDDVMNLQRKTVYDLRRRILAKEGLREYLFETARAILDGLVDQYAGGEGGHGEWDVDGLKGQVAYFFGVDLSQSGLDFKETSQDDLGELIAQLYAKKYEAKEQRLPPEAMREYERMVMLQVIDNQWKDHLLNMDHLKEGIGLRAYSQRDPLVEYKREGFDNFTAMMERVEDEIVRYLFLLEPAVTQEEKKVERRERSYSYSAPEKEEKKPAKPVTRADKVGRNDPCPCGSGKKYKKCHGAGA
jgi:preprotein translocase subunit SecA